MIKNNPCHLGINIDHIATLRQARLTPYPSLIEAVKIVEQSGGDSITLHLREDRRHIQDSDVFALRETITSKMNLEMAATNEMVDIACEVKPEYCCLVPENRQELTTEGGLEVLNQQSRLSDICAKLSENNTIVSLFVDADFAQIEAAKTVGAPVIELHTGHYADAGSNKEKQTILEQISRSATYAHSLGLQVNAGHGLHLNNTTEIAQLPEIVELNIGHSIIARAVFVGLNQAVAEMRELINNSRGDL